MRINLTKDLVKVIYITWVFKVNCGKFTDDFLFS